MKYLNYFCLIVVSTCMLTACKSKVALDDIDTTMQVDMKVAVPLATVFDNVGRFYDDDRLGSKITMDRNGILHYQDTFLRDRQYHDIELSNYTTQGSKLLPINADISEPLVIPQMQTITMDFVIPIEFNLNRDEEMFKEERLDSMTIKDALFVSKFTINNSASLSKYVKSVRVDVGDRLRRKEGSVITVYDADKDGTFHFGSEMQVPMQDFSINLMKETGLSPFFNNLDDIGKWNNNTINELNFTVYIDFQSTDGNLVIPANTTFNYEVGIKYLKFDKLWGYFRPGPQMHDADTVFIEQEWEDWKKFKTMELHLLEPVVQIEATTSIVAPLKVNAQYFFVRKEGSNNPKYATFDLSENTRNTVWNMTDEVSADEINNWVQRRLQNPESQSFTYHYTFSKDPQRGHIDRLFEERPDEMGWSYDIDIQYDYGKPCNQIRVDNDLMLHIKAMLDMPFIFGNGATASFEDTLDADFSVINFDSIANKVDQITEIKEAKAFVFLTFSNTIPLNIIANFDFMNENGEIVNIEGMIEDMDSIGSVLSNDHRLVIPAATHISSGVVKQPSVKRVRITATKDDINTLSTVRSMLYRLELATDPDSFQKWEDSEGSHTTDRVQIDQNSGLAIKLAVAADASAIMNFKTEPEEETETDNDK